MRLKKQQAKGDVPVITPVELWNSCLLDAMALPGLQRFEECPDDMRLKNGLARIPVYAKT